MGQVNERLYITELTDRIIERVNAIIKRPDEYRGRDGSRITMRHICEKSGINYWSLIAYRQRRVQLPVTAADRLLYALDITVLDLLKPVEIVSHMEGASRTLRGTVKRAGANVKKALDSVQNEE